MVGRGKRCVCVCIPGVRNTEMGRFGARVASGASGVPLEVATHLSSGSLGAGGHVRSNQGSIEAPGPQ